MTRQVKCECGEWSGERCAWEGPLSETVVVEWMPEDLRASHGRGGHHGVYPHNGAMRLRVEHSCAGRILDESGGWAQVLV
jgi:hypothetical protein